MTTAVELLNNVLVGLRRDTFSATSTTNSYHLLLLQWLNRSKLNAETRWDWHALRNTVTLTIAQGTVEYTLSGGGGATGDVAVTERSRLLYEKQVQGEGNVNVEVTNPSIGSLPQVFDTTDANEFRLIELTPERMERLHLTDDDTQNTSAYFSLSRAGGYLKIKLWPIPLATRTIKMRFVIPQSDIPSTSMDTFTIKIPDDIVWLGALERALKERGDDNASLADVQADLRDALFNALDREKLNPDMMGAPI